MPAFSELSQRRWFPLLRFVTAAILPAGESNASASLAEVWRHLFQRTAQFAMARWPRVEKLPV